MGNMLTHRSALQKRENMSDLGIEIDEIDAFDNWVSPVHICDQIVDDLNRRMEETTMQAIRKVGIDIDKDELIRALNYDRNQYEKGYSDAIRKCVQIVRCERCKHYVKNTLFGREWAWCERLRTKYDSSLAFTVEPTDFCSNGELKEECGEE